MHLETSQGSLNCGEVDEVEHDAPSSTDSDDGALLNGFHEESDNADNESSDNDDELPYNVEAFINPVYDIDDLNIEDHDDAADHNSHTGEEPFEGYYYDWNFVDQEGSSSSSEMSDEYQEDQLEIVEPNNEQQVVSNNPENINLNSIQQGALYNTENEELNNVQQGLLSNVEISTTNLFSDDCTECIFIVCDDDYIEPIAISTPSYGTSYSSNIYYGPHNFGFETPVSLVSGNLNSLNYRGPGNSGYPFSYSPYYGDRGNAGYTQTSGHCTSGFVDYETTQSSDDTSGPPVFNTSFSSRHYTSGNPGYATLQLLEWYSLLSNARYPTFHYHFSAAGRCYSEPYSTIFTITNNRSYPGLYSTNYHGAPNNRGYQGPDSTNYSDPDIQGDVVPYSTNYNIPDSRRYPDHDSINYDAPDNRGYTGPRFIIHNAPDNRWYPSSHSINYNVPDIHGYSGSRSTNYNAPDSRGYPASGYDSASDKLASGTTQSTNYFAPGAPADGTAKASAYGAPNASSYGTPTSFDQVSPKHGTSVPPAYLSPNSYDYDNPYSPNYIASESSCGATHYSKYGTPSPGYPDTLDVSENVTSQSPVTQVLSNDETSGSTASYNSGGPGTSVYGAPVTTGYGSPGWFAYAALSSIGYGAPVFSGYGVPGFYGDPRYGFFCYWGYLGYSLVDFTVYSGSDSISYGSPNSARYDASGMSGSGTPDTSDSLPQYCPTYADSSNTDHRSTGSSAYWIGYEFNLTTIFDINGYQIDRDDMEQTVLHFLVSNELYIPIVRLQSEAAAESDDGDAELGHSGGQSGRRPSFSSGSQSRSVTNSTRTHGCSHGDKHGYCQRAMPHGRCQCIALALRCDA